MTFYLKVSVLKMTFSFTFVLKKHTTPIKTENKKSPCYCIYLFTFPKLAWEVLDSSLAHEDTDLESRVQGNPSKEKTDSTISNLGIIMPTEKHFQREITNGPGRKCFPKQLCSPHKRKMCFLRRNNKIHITVQRGM